MVGRGGDFYFEAGQLEEELEKEIFLVWSRGQFLAKSGAGRSRLSCHFKQLGLKLRNPSLLHLLHARQT